MSSDRLREKPRQTARIVAAVLAVLVAALIFYLSSIQASGFPKHPGYMSIIVHLLEYSTLSILLTVAFNSPERKLWQAALMAIVATTLYGVTDEFHQYFVPTRNADPADVLTDFIGALAGAAVAVFVISARTVKKSRERDSLLR